MNPDKGGWRMGRRKGTWLATATRVGRARSGWEVLGVKIARRSCHKIKMSASQPEITLLSIGDTPGHPVGVTAFAALQHDFTNSLPALPSSGQVLELR